MYRDSTGVRKVPRKKRCTATRRFPVLDDEDQQLISKKIDYDTSSSGVMEDELNDMNAAASSSQSSDVSVGVLQPKRIDFGRCSSQRSEPDSEPFASLVADARLMSSQRS